MELVGWDKEVRKLNEELNTGKISLKAYRQFCKELYNKYYGKNGYVFK